MDRVVESVETLIGAFGFRPEQIGDLLNPRPAPSALQEVSEERLRLRCGAVDSVPTHLRTVLAEYPQIAETTDFPTVTRRRREVVGS